jgi:tRNA pseudouridine38-40 synthase
MRYRLTLEYDGGPFVGFQRQDNGPSVQGALEDAIEKLSARRVTVMAAGRTDAGVHALGQVVHFDLEKDYAAEKIRDALNFHLRPAPISVVDAIIAAPDFHARFQAKGRHYRYRILCRAAPPALDRGRVWHVNRALDAAAMHEAAQILVGHHDFSTFRASECQAQSPVKTLDRLSVHRVGEELQLIAEARSFLHRQVRSMVGTVKMVGEGKWTGRQVAAALAARDRTACGPVAPAEGLYLMNVDY